MDFYIERLDKKGESPILLAKGPTSLGRHSRNTVVLSADDRCVSGYHALIYATPDGLLLQDMQSTNGTYVNGKRIQDERGIKEGDEIGFGMSGPRFRVVRGGGSVNVDTNINIASKRDDAVVPQPPVKDKSPITPVITAKKTFVAPKYIFSAIIVIGVLTALILVISFTSSDNNSQKTSSSSSQRFSFTRGEISPDNADDTHDNVVGVSTNRQTIEARLDVILRRFGETNYLIPPEMIDRVEHYLNEYTGRRRRTIAMFMERRKQYFPMIRRIFMEQNIPLDLAYVSIVESGLDPYALSHAGARGLWQFMPRTARAYGLEVSDRKDERTDPEKSTYAAAAYFKHLIAIFGSRSSVMLCMAAYNAGETRIINALKRIEDPMKNRDFWYLYRRKWLAEETNEYIPQILAFIILSEHMKEYGFE